MTCKCKAAVVAAYQEGAKNAEQRMRGLFAELYQVLGALDAPENVLDQVSAAANGDQLPHETLLPFFVEPAPDEIHSAREAMDYAMDQHNKRKQEAS